MENKLWSIYLEISNMSEIYEQKHGYSIKTDEPFQKVLDDVISLVSFVREDREK